MCVGWTGLGPGWVIFDRVREQPPEDFWPKEQENEVISEENEAGRHEDDIKIGRVLRKATFERKPGG